MRLFEYCIPALALGASVPALAAQLDHGRLDRVIEQFTGAPIGVEGGARLPVDRRLRLAVCEADLRLEWFGRARDTVLVQCDKASGWKLYVPVVRAAQRALASNVVTRNDLVSLTVQGDGFSLARKVQALDDGAVGEWVRVRPVDGKAAPFRARVLEPGKVGMNLP